jgi:hypothetical protein
MTAIAQDSWQEQEDDPEVRIDGIVQPEREDAYWQSVYWAQPFYRADLSYDDYAPAFCVGYIGYAQYGGRFDEAEKSLCANWIRIKGDSRLGLEDAMGAIRAAWEHAAIGQAMEEEEEMADAGYAAQAHARSSRQPALAAA